MLHVHHLRYGRFYDVTIDDLMVVCNPCHAKIHFFNLQSREEIIAKLSRRKLSITNASPSKISIWGRGEIAESQEKYWMD